MNINSVNFNSTNFTQDGILKWSERIRFGKGRVFKAVDMGLSWSAYVAGANSLFPIAQKNFKGAKKGLAFISFPRNLYKFYLSLFNIKIKTIPHTVKNAFVALGSLFSAIAFANHLGKEFSGGPLLVGQVAELIGRVSAITAIAACLIGLVDFTAVYASRKQDSLTDQTYDLTVIAYKTSLLFLNFTVLLAFTSLVLPSLVGLCLTTLVFILFYLKHFFYQVINPRGQQEIRCASEARPNQRDSVLNDEDHSREARPRRKIDVAKPQQADYHLLTSRVNKGSI